MVFVLWQWLFERLIYRSAAVPSPSYPGQAGKLGRSWKLCTDMFVVALNFAKPLLIQILIFFAAILPHDEWLFTGHLVSIV